MTKGPSNRTFQITFENRKLTFWLEFSKTMNRECVNGPAELIDDRNLLLQSRKAAVEVARTMGILETKR